MALHPQAGQTEGLRLENSDRLAHDGGALLNHINGISSIRKSGVYGFDPVFRGFKYDQRNVVINGTQTASVATRATGTGIYDGAQCLWNRQS